MNYQQYKFSACTKRNCTYCRCSLWCAESYASHFRKSNILVSMLVPKSVALPLSMSILVATKIVIFCLYNCLNIIYNVRITTKVYYLNYALNQIIKKFLPTKFSVWYRKIDYFKQFFLWKYQDQFFNVDRSRNDLCTSSVNGKYKNLIMILSCLKLDLVMLSME
jgi:hypothetical protein